MTEINTVNALAIERKIKDQFGVALDVEALFIDAVDVSRTAEATVFLTQKKQLYLYIEAQAKLLLSDIKKIVSKMGLSAEIYVPPKGQPRYFEEIGVEKFKEVFPGRTNITDKDIMFYKTLSPYNPALVVIKEVKNGIIYKYDADAKNDWRPSAKYAFHRISTN